MMFQVWVKVVTPDYQYWNKLSQAWSTYESAKACQAWYERCKAHGLDGFHKGPPAETKIEETK